MKTKKALFLDRDGTLNKDTGYVHKAEDWQWMPQARETTALANSLGFVVVIITNQSGIARGFLWRGGVFRVAAKSCRRLTKVSGSYRCDLFLPAFARC